MFENVRFEEVESVPQSVLYYLHVQKMFTAYL